MPHMSSRVIDVQTRKTSMRLNPCEWKAIDTICQRENIKRKKLFELIDANKDNNLGLTSSIRLFTIIYYKNSVHYATSSSDNFQNPIYEAITGISK